MVVFNHFVRPKLERACVLQDHYRDEIEKGFYVMSTSENIKSILSESAQSKSQIQRLGASRTRAQILFYHALYFRPTLFSCAQSVLCLLCMPFKELLIIARNQVD